MRCRHYSPQGRRGGMCQKLSAPVRGDWQACSLVNSPFMPTWETWEAITLSDGAELKPLKTLEKVTAPAEIAVELEMEAENDSQTTISA